MKFCGEMQFTAECARCRQCIGVGGSAIAEYGHAGGVPRFDPQGKCPVLVDNLFGAQGNQGVGLGEMKKASPIQDSYLHHKQDFPKRWSQYSYCKYSTD